ncbi:hypothetical protein K503DRAFT_773222 [Rhizopogon vinicolor AM-OR11-026]|uniref:DUF6533 domain-containing protein n=1 Tax=Rhizopogon vinicolor AM-OR11-026 TaxID=1314800 RepID=A0A1B7MSW0_9AGAM|nr:hypothetical protein K503DRAFT_773222 [Rhizopogon vinicolor AM-OR11-026]
MATSISTLPTPFLTTAFDDQQLKYFSLIGPTILAYDWLLTIGSEFTYVWSRRWGIIELLYLFSRYLPFVDTPIVLIYHFYLMDPSIEACHTALTAQCVMYIIGISISEQIFMIRTWAVWKKNNVVRLVLFIGSALVSITQLCLTAVYASSLTYFLGYNLGGCFVINSSSKVALLSIGIFLFVQFTYLMLVVLKIYPTVRGKRGISLLLNVILQDGIFFYIMLFGEDYLRHAEQRQVNESGSSHSRQYNIPFSTGDYLDCSNSPHSDLSFCLCISHHTTHTGHRRT